MLYGTSCVYDSQDYDSLDYYSYDYRNLNYCLPWALVWVNVGRLEEVPLTAVATEGARRCGLQGGLGLHTSQPDFFLLSASTKSGQNGNKNIHLANFWYMKLGQIDYFLGTFGRLLGQKLWRIGY